ncbi:17371_t:CDS:2, partial [Dentiscutata heterogama]
MNNLLENQIEVENDQSSRPTTPHMQVIPANQSVKSWVWLFVNKQTRCCQVIIEDKGKEEAEVINSETHNRNFPLEQNKIKRITYHLIDWLIDDMQAFHVVENRKFQNFVHELESFYSIPYPIASDTETRWNSTFFLLERLIYFRNTLSILGNKLALDPDRTTRNDGDNLKKLLLNSDNWTSLEELILLLRPFVDATNLTSGSSYSTLSL